MTGARTIASTPGSALKLWLPALLWPLIIIVNSGDYLSANHTYGMLHLLLQHYLGLPISNYAIDWLNVLARKSAHFLEYGLLYFLYYRAIGSLRVTLLARYVLPLVAVLVFASADEWRQSFTRERHASPFDVVLDLSGGLAAATLLLRRHHPPAAEPLASFRLQR